MMLLDTCIAGLFHRAITHSVPALTPCSIGSPATKYAREVAAFLSCPVDGKKMSQMVECLRRKSVSELLAADSFFLATMNASARLAAPSLRFPMEDIFSMFPPNNGSIHGKSQAIDSSKIVQQQNPGAGHWSEESSSSSSSSVTSDLRLDSYPLGNNGNVVSNTLGNKSKGVSSESRNSGNNYSSSHNSSLSTAVSIILVGVVFLLLNILLLLREFYKRDKRRRGPQDRKTHKQNHASHSSEDSSPNSNQVCSQFPLITCHKESKV